jgi:hypothetical protein
MEFGGGRAPTFYFQLGVVCKGYMEARVLLGIFFSHFGREIKGCSWRPASGSGGSSPSNDKN